MTDASFFDNMDFSAEDAPVDAETAIRKRHDPQLAYAHIVKLCASVDAGLDSVPEKNRTTAKAYSSVDLFRATIQYVEEFGIYLRSQAVQNESFIESLIRTSAGDLVPLFEACRDHSIDEYLSEQNTDLTKTDWLCEVFGYSEARNGSLEITERESETQLTDDEVEARIEESLSFIESELEEIATFYLDFKEAYNAVKHGNRVYIMPHSSFEIDVGESESYDVNPENPYVSFLCKESDERRDGNPYFLALPSSFLDRWSIDIADRVNQLYTTAYDVSVRESDESLRGTFFKQSDSSETVGYMTVQNSDGTVFIPAENVPDELRDFELPDGTTAELLGNLYLSEGTVHVNLSYGTEPTQEYPAEVEFTYHRGKREVRNVSKSDFGVSVDDSLLSVSQYLELKKIADRGSIDKIELIPPGETESTVVRLEEPVEAPEMPEQDDFEFLEWLNRIELASGERIPLPNEYSQRHTEIFEENRDKNLDRELAREIREKLRSAGEHNLKHYLIVNVWDYPRDEHESDKGDPEISDEWGPYNGGVVFRTSETEEGYRDPGLVSTADFLSTKTVDEILEDVRANGIEGITEPDNVEVSPEEGETEIMLRTRFGEQTFWETVDIIVLNLFKEK